MISETSEFFSTEQVGRFINRSPAAVRNLVLRRKIPFRKPAGRLVFLRSEIERWIQTSPGLYLQDIEK